MKKIYTFVITLTIILCTSTVFAESMPVPINSSAKYCFSLTRGLKLGVYGKDVFALQQFLNSDQDTRVSTSGAGSPGYETEYFGPATMRAVSRFQEKYRDEILTPLGLVRGTGTFSNSSWKKLARIHNCDSINPISNLTITSISPSSAMVGDQVTIIVNRALKGSITVNFSGSNYIGSIYGGEITKIDDNRISFVIPARIYSPVAGACAPQGECGFKVIAGNYNIVVTDNSGKSNSVTLKIVDSNTSDPTITNISPSSGKVGTVVTVSGWNFSNVFGVSFAGGRIPASQITYLSSNSNQTFQFTVPEYVTPTPLNCFSPVANCVLPMIAKVISPGTYDVQVVTDKGVSNTVPFTVTTTSDNTNITVLSPKSGDVWNRNDNHTIQWQTPNVTYIQASRFNIYLEPKLEYYCTNSFSSTNSYPSHCSSTSIKPYTIAENVIGSGGISSYSWNVGTGAEAGRTILDGEYRVKVCNQGNSNCDESGLFIIRTTNTNKAPVISGVDTPTMLRVGQTGTWTIRATDPENNGLSYTVRWGDESAIANGGTMASIPPAYNYVQNTSFTHTYNSVGSFQPTFYVMDSAGAVASVSATVNITY